jgi:hypothetical protein
VGGGRADGNDGHLGHDAGVLDFGRNAVVIV